MLQLNTVINELIKMEEKYRVGRKLGMVILDTKTSREVARATTEEMADNICKLLNHQSKVNNGVLDDVISCKNCKSDKTKLIVEKRIYCDNCVCSYYL